MRPRAIICSLMILPCAGLTSILKTLRSTTLRCSSGTFGRHFEGPRALIDSDGASSFARHVGLRNTLAGTANG
jgi:hypothetical protein